MFNDALLPHSFQFQQRAIITGKGSTLLTHICPLASKNTSLARHWFSNLMYLAVSQCCAKDVLLLLLDPTRGAPVFMLTCSVYCVFVIKMIC